MADVFNTTAAHQLHAGNRARRDRKSQQPKQCIGAVGGPRMAINPRLAVEFDKERQTISPNKVRDAWGSAVEGTDLASTSRSFTNRVGTAGAWAELSSSTPALALAAQPNMSPTRSMSSTIGRNGRAEDQIGSACNLPEVPDSRPGSAGAIEIVDVGKRPSSQPNGRRMGAGQEPGLKRVWYPHASTNRGQLKLTGPRAMQLGVDPGKDTGHTCPFWAADAHRFAATASYPDAHHRTPTKADRWHKEEAWQDGSTVANLKVTHLTPTLPNTFAYC